jgi:deoxycytidylate deaminase
MTKPDPTLLIDVVAPKVLEALRLASEALTTARVRHVVVGGLAVGVNGYPRATKDVDDGGSSARVHEAQVATSQGPGGRVIELIKGGIDAKRCREYLAAHAAALVAVFDECVAQADAEQG